MTVFFLFFFRSIEAKKKKRKKDNIDGINEGHFIGVQQMQIRHTEKVVV